MGNISLRGRSSSYVISLNNQRNGTTSDGSPTTPEEKSTEKKEKGSKEGSTSSSKVTSDSDLEHAGVDEIESKILTARSTHALDLQGCRLTTLPELLYELHELVGLNLGNNELAELAPQLDKLLALNSLKVNGNKLSDFPNVKLGLEVLDIGRNRFEILPESICELTSLLRLILHCNRLVILPESLGELSSLTVLDLSTNNLKELPPDIGKLSGLKSLDIDNNRIETLPLEFGKLAFLTQLTCNNNLLEEVPECICQLAFLQQLNLRNNRLTTLPAAFSRLENLNKLDLGCNLFVDFPESVSGCRTLIDLNLSGNKLLNVAPCVSALSELATFNLAQNRLTTLPATMGDMTVLMDLNLTDNQISTVPKEMGQLGYLGKLFLTQNCLRHLPTDLAGMKFLEELDLSGNHLKELPVELCQLEKLKSLQLNDNKLRTLPKEIGNLHRLNHISLAYNKITSLPDFTTFTRLQTLSLFNNKLKKLPGGIETFKHLECLNAGDNLLDDNSFAPFLTESVDLRELESLHLSGNRLSTIPEGICNLTMLKELMLCRNEITEITPSISKLSKIRMLNLASNSVRAIPTQIQALSSLRELNLSYNKLTRVPIELGQLTNLNVLCLSHNELAILPLELTALKPSCYHMDLTDNLAPDLHAFLDNDLLDKRKVKKKRAGLRVKSEVRDVLARTRKEKFNFVGLSEMMGKRARMEDTISCQLGFNGEKGEDFFGLFDGHAGRECAMFAASTFHSVLAGKLTAATIDDVNFPQLGKAKRSKRAKHKGKQKDDGDSRDQEPVEEEPPKKKRQKEKSEPDTSEQEKENEKENGKKKGKLPRKESEDAAKEKGKDKRNDTEEEKEPEKENVNKSWKKSKSHRKKKEKVGSDAETAQEKEKDKDKEKEKEKPKRSSEEKARASKRAKKKSQESASSKETDNDQSEGDPSIFPEEIKGKKADPKAKRMFKCLRRTFATMDERMQSYKDGTTAVVALVSAQLRKLFVANVGDARAVLCRNGKPYALTVDHTPKLASEAERVRALNGYVTSNRVNGIIAVSRSLGDAGLKPFVISTPGTRVIDLCDEDEFLILACDGCWDTISNRKAVEIVAQELKETGDCARAAIKLKEHAFWNGSTDNISVIVISLQHYLNLPVEVEPNARPFLSLGMMPTSSSLTHISAPPTPAGGTPQKHRRETTNESASGGKRQKRKKGAKARRHASDSALRAAMAGLAHSSSDEPLSKPTSPKRKKEKLEEKAKDKEKKVEKEKKNDASDKPGFKRGKSKRGQRAAQDKDEESNATAATKKDEKEKEKDKGNKGRKKRALTDGSTKKDRGDKDQVKDKANNKDNAEKDKDKPGTKGRPGKVKPKEKKKKYKKKMSKSSTVLGTRSRSHSIDAEAMQHAGLGSIDENDERFGTQPGGRRLSATGHRDKRSASLSDEVTIFRPRSKSREQATQDADVDASANEAEGGDHVQVREPAKEDVKGKQVVGINDPDTPDSLIETDDKLYLGRTTSHPSGTRSLPDYSIIDRELEARGVSIVSSAPDFSALACAAGSGVPGRVITGTKPIRTRPKSKSITSRD